MKQILSFALLFSLSLMVKGQELPSSGATYWDEAPVYDITPFDQTSLMEEADKAERERGRTMNGKLRFVDFDFFNEADYNILPNGSEVWRLTFHSDGALALNVYFDDFYLPEGSALYISNLEGTYWEGPIGSEENNDHGRFMTNEIFGEDIVLEYVQTAGTNATAKMKVMAVGYIFRYAYDPLRYGRAGGGSQPCEVDVNCPEADGWTAQKDAVVRLRITDSGQQFLCSGAMVRTTCGDFRQYLLSALHCADGVSNADLNFLQVRFNYERPDDSACGSGSFSSSRNRTGVIRLADSGSIGGNLTGADFLLVEVEDNIPDSWNPFFAGWESDGQGSSAGVCIHHPAGDIKKISTYTNPLSNAWLTTPNAHWEVTWSPTVTDHGVTEGGSSGSPIFNTNGLIIGVLSAGFSACSNGGAGAGTGPFEPDYYGKVSFAWDQDGVQSDERLDVWLGECDGGVNSVEGSYRDGTTAIMESDEEVSFEVNPNPTNGLINVSTNAFEAGQQVSLFDGQGKLLENFNLTTQQMNLDLTVYPAGVYFVQLQNEAGAQARRVVKF